MVQGINAVPVLQLQHREVQIRYYLFLQVSRDLISLDWIDGGVVIRLIILS